MTLRWIRNTQKPDEYEKITTRSNYKTKTECFDFRRKIICLYWNGSIAIEDHNDPKSIKAIKECAGSSSAPYIKRIELLHLFNASDINIWMPLFFVPGLRGQNMFFTSCSLQLNVKPTRKTYQSICKFVLCIIIMPYLKMIHCSENASYKQHYNFINLKNLQIFYIKLFQICVALWTL
ncbi:unnamed protein product [Blepharisma stoltei]|uniref:Uncharacterized protein n=1 Tax=Blepharisma stoltei TaxID=1481888 RepID=A0AAU9JDZ8_9CILI|nr:unnamed protein product [Blepharisma stoltei]